MRSMENQMMMKMTDEKIKEQLIDLETVLIAEDGKLHRMLELNTRLRDRIEKLQRIINDREKIADSDDS